MGQDALHDLVLDPVNRVEGGHGLLEDHGDLVAPDGLHLLFGHLGQVLAVEQDLAVADPAGLFDKTHDGEGGDALSGAGLSHYSQDLAFFDLKAYAVDRLDKTSFDLEFCFEIFYFKQHDGTPLYPFLRIQGVSQAVSEQIEGKHGYGDHQAREHQGVGR